MTNDESKKKLLYSVEEACDALSLGSTAVYTEINKGNLAAKKYGKRTLILGSSIEEWVNALPEKEKVGGQNNE